MCGKWIAVECCDASVVVGVRRCFWANLQLGYMDRQDKDSADALEIYQGQWWPWILVSWAPDTVFRPVITGMASPSWQHHLLGTLSLPVFQHYTQGPCHNLKKLVMTNYTRNMCTLWSTSTNTSPYHMFIFLAVLSVHLCCNASSNSSNVLLSNLAHISNFYNSDITSLHLLFLDFCISIYITLSWHN
jgi:hypothetical protein